ncbi:MAG: FHA domain-containing protein [Deltaproteobacteria bacterium]|nr:FHA domain-containing protein [Deltaproteobacteria bacterium]
MPFLLSITGPDGKTREFKLVEGETTVGRDATNALVLDGRGVSRHHATLVVDSDRVAIVDLGSTYGTKVNELPAVRRELSTGDRVKIGMHQLTIRRVERTSSAELRPGALAPTGYSVDDVTLDPAPSIHERKTVQVNRAAVQFVLDNPDTKGHAVTVLSRRESSLVEAVERLGADRPTPVVGIPISGLETPTADYQALILMYRVSQQLAAAADLDGFLAPVADMVMEEVGADTVVVLLVDRAGELKPRVVRHRGELGPDELPVSRTVVDLVLREKETVLSTDVGHDRRINAGDSLALYNIRSVVASPILVHGTVRGVLYLNRAGGVPFASTEGDLVTALASLLSSGADRAELKESIAAESLRRKALERFHPPEVVDRIFQRGGRVGDMEEHHATALVCDLQGFDALVGQVDPQELATVLHDYYGMVYEQVFANGGSLVKLHGGYALALFGAPESRDRDAVWAAEAALRLCEELTSAAALWPRGQSLALRCSLDTGSLVAGILGPADRLEYVAMGGPIALASELARRHSGTAVLVTEATLRQLPSARYHGDELALLPDRRTYRLLQR